MPTLLNPYLIYDTQIDGLPLWQPNERTQQQILASDARHRLWCAGRRSGKSDLARMLIPEAYRAYFMQDELRRRGIRMDYWLVGPQFSDPEKEFRVLWRSVERLGMPLDKPGSYYDPIGMNMHISLWDGLFQVHAKSARYPEQLVGEALHGVFLCEAAKMKPSIWVKYIRPMLSDFDGWSIHSSTPEGFNHFAEHYEMGQDPSIPEWFSLRTPSWWNSHVFKTPTNDEDVTRIMELMDEHRGATPHALASAYNLVIDSEVLELMTDLSVPMFKQEIMADFNVFIGQVFSDYDEEYHVADLKYNAGWQTFAAVDWGYTNPSVWLLIQVGPWGEINVLSEVYETGMTAVQFADEILRRGLCPPNLQCFYPDPASPGDTRILSEALKVPHMGNTGGELAHRIDLIRKSLRQSRADYDGATASKSMLGESADFRPQLMFDRSCINTRRDMSMYRYPDNSEAPEPGRVRFEQPLKKDDHGPEALGRFYAGFFGAQSLWGQAGTRVTKAKVSRSRRHLMNSPGITAESVGAQPLTPSNPLWQAGHDNFFRRGKNE